MHFRICALVIVALVAAPMRVYAQDDVNPTDAELAEEEARALFGAGVAAFDAGRFQDALWSFERAFERSGRPELLYNVGQCHDRMRQDEQAIAAFERYLELVPAASNRTQVEGRMRALRDVIARRNAPPVVVPPPAEVAQEAAQPAPAVQVAASPARDAPAHPHRGRRIAIIAASVVVVGAVITTLVVVRHGDSYSPSDVGVVFALHGALR